MEKQEASYDAAMRRYLSRKTAVAINETGESYPRREEIYDRGCLAAEAGALAEPSAPK